MYIGHIFNSLENLYLIIKFFKVFSIRNLNVRETNSTLVQIVQISKTTDVINMHHVLS